MEVEGKNQNPSPNSNEVEEKEGRFLLGSPTFSELGNGRFKCTETGHELPARERDSYAKSKRCRLGLIEAALLHKKAPLNFFKQDPGSKMKLMCKLTGDIINKSEEHIWKHISGKRFHKRLEQKELEMETSNGMAERDEKAANSNRKWVKKAQQSGIQKHESEELEEPMRDSNSDSDEAEFWVPPVGERWDSDNGKDRWESCTTSGQDDAAECVGREEDDPSAEDTGDHSMGSKQISESVGPSSPGPRKKKSKTNATNSSRFT